MKPYYKDESGMIFNCDCREGLLGLSGALVCTDPPYNCGKNYGVWDDNLPTSEYQQIMRDIAALCMKGAPNPGLGRTALSASVLDGCVAEFSLGSYSTRSKRS